MQGGRISTTWQIEGAGTRDQRDTARPLKWAPANERTAFQDARGWFLGETVTYCCLAVPPALPLHSEVGQNTKTHNSIDRWVSNLYFFVYIEKTRDLNASRTQD